MTITEFLKFQEKERFCYWSHSSRHPGFLFNLRAQMVNHLFHLLPGENLLEVGCGSGQFLRELNRITKGSNPLHGITFDSGYYRKYREHKNRNNIAIELTSSFPAQLKESRFSFIVGWHILTREFSLPLLTEFKKLLKPGGQIIFFEINPLNPFNHINRISKKIKTGSRYSPFTPQNLYHMLSVAGFTHIKVLPFDFTYLPFLSGVTGLSNYLKLTIENMPVVKNLSSSICVWGQSPLHHGMKRSWVNLVRYKEIKGKLSVVIPCRNEALNIAPLVEGLKGLYDDYIYEIIIVDDNSSDNTGEVVEAIQKEYRKVHIIHRSMPNGVGLALRDGIKRARGSYVLLMDCDFKHILPELTKLFDAIAGGADMAIGSRFSPEGVLLDYPFLKIVCNRGFHLLAKILLNISIRDVTNNLKLMKSEVAQNIDIEYHDFSANAETGLKPILQGYNVQEVPISWINRSIDMGSSNFNLIKTGHNYVKLLCKLFFRYSRSK